MLPVLLLAFAIITTEGADPVTTEDAMALRTERALIVTEDGTRLTDEAGVSIIADLPSPPVVAFLLSEDGGRILTEDSQPVEIEP